MFIHKLLTYTMWCLHMLSSKLEVTAVVCGQLLAVVSGCRSKLYRYIYSFTVAELTNPPMLALCATCTHTLMHDIV